MRGGRVKVGESRTLAREGGIRPRAWSGKSGVHCERRQIPRRKGRASEAIVACIDIKFANIFIKGKKEFISLMRRSNSSIKLQISMLCASCIQQNFALWNMQVF